MQTGAIKREESRHFAQSTKLAKIDRQERCAKICVNVVGDRLLFALITLRHAAPQHPNPCGAPTIVTAAGRTRRR